MAPPPDLTGDAVAEILLRLPPEDPACLVRASLLHRTPSLLGFLDEAYACEALSSGSFVPVAARVPALVQPALESAPVRRAVDCRHGRVLLHVVGTRGREVLRRRNPYVPSYNQCGAVLCSAAGCDHRDYHGGPFAVVILGNAAVAGPPRAVEWAYSSKAAAWSAPVSLGLGQDPSDVTGRGAIVGDVHGPHGNGGRRWFAGARRRLGSTLRLWSRKADDDPIMGFATTVIDLDNLLPLDGRRYHKAYVTGFAEGVHALLLSTDATIFVFELKSGRVRSRKVGQLGFYYHALPFMRFYIPAKLTLPAEETD
ncbi:hypothetical protein BS78_02G023500 [Paspalum vaginatum]|nr:hypothetical protein BS78_02G023500 [Paspalum vaginatum]